jgi:L-alanine-DL-glutamate epimerase-like enolase superfamily enzyme
MELEIRDLDLPMRHPFTIAHGTTTIQHNLLVTLSQDGMTGYGEAASCDAYPDFTVQSMRSALESARSEIERESLGDPTELWERLLPSLGHNRFALCAVDEAAHDLWGKLRHRPVWRLWGLQLRNLPFSDYTIGIDSVEKMVAKMQEFDGWPIYKIKLGTSDDLAIVRELRRHTKAAFRVDANTAWTVEKALAYAPELKRLGVEFIEQPLPPDDWEGMRRVFAECALPVIADESCLVEKDVARCVGHFHGINIKLTKAGGLTPARRMIAQARELGLRVMVGCMNESTIGISAIAQLLPLLDYVDMDGALLIAEDVASGVYLDKGWPILPNENGNGVRLLS